MYVLIDCNNFYASCERLFRPDLRETPIVVLSNNDGCVIARSNESKALGIAMGEPFFKIKALCKQHNIHVFSSNYTLYGDLSQRIMSTIEDEWPYVEIYSIDEAFLDLTTLPTALHDSFCMALQRRIFKQGYHYKKAGVCLEDLIPKEHRQLDLFQQPSDEALDKTERFMSIWDTINKKYGRSTLRLAAEGYSKPWAMRMELKSPAYTTRWSDLPIVRLWVFKFYDYNRIYYLRVRSTQKLLKRVECDKFYVKKPSIMNDSHLGKQSIYDSIYNPNLLYPISRSEKRQEIGIDPGNLPFMGFDCWNHYEVSWLNERGKPMVGFAEIIYDCKTPKLIESKSLKLYFNSFNNTKIKNSLELENTVKQDLEKAIEAPVLVNIYSLEEPKQFAVLQSFAGESLDNLDIECSVYRVEPSFLSVNEEVVEEILYSNLLKSNCLITNQPDWGSIQINYKGKKINREGLLKYLISYRNHNEFHEQCIERIFVDIINYCKPETLTVYGRYTRRGGLDINPYRSTEKTSLDRTNLRLLRQ